MTKQEVILYAKKEFGFVIENNDWLAVVRLRHKAVILPEYDCMGTPRDESEWVILDMAGKIDTGRYGEIYYV